MITFEVKDMTCGHCVSIITKAVKAVDQEAKVSIDLGRKLVTVEPTESDSQALCDSISEAGYTPVAVELANADIGARASKGGGCCGGCH